MFDNLFERIDYFTTFLEEDINLIFVLFNYPGQAYTLFHS